MSQESLPSPEQMHSKPSFEVMLARHAAYYDPRAEAAMKADGIAEEEIRSKVGHLTEQGREQAREFGIDVLKRVLEKGEDTDITFISSNQLYESPDYPDAPWSGKRAEETAESAMTAVQDAIQTGIADGSIRTDQIRLMTPLPAKAFTDTGSKPNERLVEREVYNPYNALMTSMISRYRDRTSQVMDDEMKIENHVTGGYTVPSEGSEPSFTNPDKREKELWSRGEQDIDRFAAAMSAETSSDVSSRVMSVIDDMAELASMHQERAPGRKLLVVLISHDAVSGAVTSKGMGAEYPVIPSYMDHIDININNGVASFEQGGKLYKRTLIHED